MILIDAVHKILSQHRKIIWIAYSGGLDSQVLLSICSTLPPEIKTNVRAIHIQHGISANADDWAKHCKASCDLFGITYIENKLHLDLRIGESLEEAAREKRYAVFSEYIDQGDVLLTAHHQDDQAETLLLQLMRGAGPKGLSAMPVSKVFGKGQHIRPLLHFTRCELEQYAKEHQLKWIEDESNHDCSLSRNFIRHEILPKLKSRWPTVTTSIARSASHCAENQKLIEEFSRDLYLQVQGSRPDTLSVSKLQTFAPEKQRLILRTWIQYLKFPLPNTKRLETIRLDVLTASWDSKPLVQWVKGDVKVALRRHKDDLHLTKVSKLSIAKQVFNWNLESSLSLPGVGVLQAHKTQGKGLRVDIKNVSVRYRQGGEIIDLCNRGKHTLKNIFQEWNILPWERELLPLIYIEDKLVAIVDYFIHESVAVKNNEPGYEIILTKQS